MPFEAKRYLIRRVDDTEIFYIVDLINAYYDIKNPVFPTGIYNVMS